MVFFQIVFAETILSWIWKLQEIWIVVANFILANKLNFCYGNYSREETICGSTVIENIWLYFSVNCGTTFSSFLKELSEFIKDTFWNILTFNRWYKKILSSFTRIFSEFFSWPIDTMTRFSLVSMIHVELVIMNVSNLPKTYIFFSSDFTKFCPIQQK